MTYAVVECELCPKLCRIAHGQSGECRVRVNVEGRLRSVVYGHPCSMHVDPIEKKPLFHFHPGTPIFSIATVGCNLGCINCQNWEISQTNPEDAEHYDVPPEEVVTLAMQAGCRAIAYTYTDPSVYYEYARDTAVKARAAGMKNVLVTAGYLNPEPARRLLAHIDGAHIDLKSIRDAFYREICGATLAPVLTYLKLAREAGVWVEVANLVIPTKNDDPRDLRDLARWVLANLGPDTPLHFLRFGPRYKLTNLPPTPESTLEEARRIAMEVGLRYVYLGNVQGTPAESTWCPGCRALLVERVGFRVRRQRVSGGRCPECGMRIAGVWDDGVVPPEPPAGRAP